MKFIKLDRDYIFDILKNPRGKNHPFTFRGIRLFDGFYIGFIWCRLK
jgi:hypothetical protein